MFLLAIYKTKLLVNSYQATSVPAISSLLRACFASSSSFCKEESDIGRYCKSSLRRISHIEEIRSVGLNSGKISNTIRSTGGTCP